MVENSELARQTRHYLAVRERLARPGDAAGRSARIKELEGQLADLASDNEAKGRRIARLEADLADAGARLLAQARSCLAAAIPVRRTRTAATERRSRRSLPPCSRIFPV